MSAPTKIDSTGKISIAVNVAGNPIPEKYQIKSILVNQTINRISFAKVSLLDGDAANEKFDVSSGDDFLPGKEITVEAGYDNKNKTVFKGIITRQSIKANASECSVLEIECKDKAVKMTVGRKSCVYTKKKDSDAMTTVIGNSAGVDSDVTATSTTIPCMVQNYSTDWDFMMSRAEANGMVVSAINNKVSVFKPDKNNSPVLTVKYGTNMMSFDADLNSVSQLAKVKASAWDFTSQKLITAEASNDVDGPGNITSKKLSDVVGLEEFDIQTTAAEQNDEITDWAKAQMLKREYAKIIGETSFQGNTTVEPGHFITIAGMGDRFNGDHFVSCIIHEISCGNWVTTAGIGLSPAWFSRIPDIMVPAASGQLPGIEGLYNATVKKIDSDPDSEFRIQINLPLLDPTDEGIWARLANNYSSNGFGAFFLPEVDDEVIVGFLNNDPRYPIILGSVYSSKLKPFDDFKPDEKNPLKGIVTKNKIKMTFDDDKKIITLATPGENQITLDDDKKALTLITKNKNQLVLDDDNKKVIIKDQNENTITMSDSGIEIKSKKNINLESDQKVSIKGKQGISMQASGGDVEIKGMNVKNTADTQFSAEGSATASVKGGSQLTLKAAMVMIN